MPCWSVTSHAPQHLQADNSVRDLSGRLWGWENQTSCAFKNEEAQPIYYQTPVRGYSAVLDPCIDAFSNLLTMLLSQTCRGMPAGCGPHPSRPLMPQPPLHRYDSAFKRLGHFPAHDWHRLRPHPFACRVHQLRQLASPPHSLLGRLHLWLSARQMQLRPLIRLPSQLLMPMRWPRMQVG